MAVRGVLRSLLRGHSRRVACLRVQRLRGGTTSLPPGLYPVSSAWLSIYPATVTAWWRRVSISRVSASAR